MGSGRWKWRERTKKRTVEACGVIDIDALTGAGLFDFRSGFIGWTNPANGKKNHAIYQLESSDVPTCIYLYLIYASNQDELARQPITVLSKPQPFGGVRWCFFCPKWCKRWVRRLYSLPGNGFGCRHCQDLVHARAQHHDRRFDVLRRDPQLAHAAAKAGSILALKFLRMCTTIYG